MALEPGLSFEVERLVEAHLLASALGSGAAPVFATPAMVALCEEAAFRCVAPYLEEGQSTVGTFISVRHLAATPPGMKVRATARVRAVTGRALSFEIEVWDEVEKIGECSHERHIIDERRFLTRVRSKLGL